MLCSDLLYTYRRTCDDGMQSYSGGQWSWSTAADP